VTGGELRASRALGGRLRTTLAYGAARAGARLAELGYVEHGPRVELRLELSRTLRAGASAAFTARRYAAFDPALGARRSDSFLDGSVYAEWDPAPRWSARVGLAGRRAGSSLDAFAYSKVVPTVGFGYVLGL
jgi:hypothetical protein